MVVRRIRFWISHTGRATVSVIAAIWAYGDRMKILTRNLSSSDWNRRVRGTIPGVVVVFTLCLTSCGGGSGENPESSGTPSAPALQLRLLAGNAGGAGNLDGIGTSARFVVPSGIALDANGNIFVADAGSNTIRKITPAGLVSTLAGNPNQSGNADGRGANARFLAPDDIAIDPSGNLFVSDLGNRTIRKITPAGDVTTFAGTVGKCGSADGVGTATQFCGPTRLAMDASGNLFVADSGNYTIRKITPAAVVTTVADTVGECGDVDGIGATARLCFTGGLAIDTSGNLLVTDEQKNTVRTITPAGVVTTLAGRAAVSGSTDGTGAVALFAGPRGIAVDRSGNIFVADRGNQTIRQITSAGIVSTLAGAANNCGSTDGLGSVARFCLPTGLTIDASGKLFVTDAQESTVRRITPTGVVSTVAGAAAVFGSSDGAGTAALFRSPRGVAVNRDGNFIVADTNNHTIRQITPSGIVTTLAGTAGNCGRADGTALAAEFCFPGGVSVDADGNVIVADTGTYGIRKVTPAGVVSTSAATVGICPNNLLGLSFFGSYVCRFTAVAVDAVGNILAIRYFGDALKISPTGTLSTLTGANTGSAPGLRTEDFGPTGIAVDSGGNVFVANSFNHTILKITSPGIVSTLAGSTGICGNVDGVGIAAQLCQPHGLAVDSNGNVFVADTRNNAIRKITPGGVVTTYVGSSTTSVALVTASLNRPLGVAISNNGLVITSENAVFTLQP